MELCSKQAQDMALMRSCQIPQLDQAAGWDGSSSGFQQRKVNISLRPNSNGVFFHIGYVRSFVVTGCESICSSSGAKHKGVAW